MGLPPIKDENAFWRDLDRKDCLILIEYSYNLL